MNKDLLVKLSVEENQDDGEWDIRALLPFSIQEHRRGYLVSYKTHAGAIKAAKRLLPLFVNAVLEE